jgi:hypothetical protein
MKKPSSYGDYALFKPETTRVMKSTSYSLLGNEYANPLGGVEIGLIMGIIGGILGILWRPQESNQDMHG